MLTNLRISTKPEEIDSTWVITELRATYLGERLTPIQIMRAMDHSLCFCAYLDNAPGTQQVGFARVVTDRSVFSSITDMLVGEAHRRHGVGTALLAAILAHPWVAPTICILESRYAADFYAKQGFKPVTAGVMRRMPST